MVNYNIACEPMWHVLTDVTRWDAGVARNTDSSLQRIAEATRTRGIRILLSILPKLGKDLDKGLSSGSLIISQEVRDEFGHSNPCPLFEHLFYKVFDVDSAVRLSDGSYSMPILWNSSTTAVAFLRQFLYMYKKVEWPCPQENVRATARSFFSIDLELREPWLHWDTEPVFFESSLAHWRQKLTFVDGLTAANGLLSSTERKLASTLDKVVSRVMGKLPQVDRQSLRPKHGPGAVADMPSSSDKYQFLNWPRKLDHYFPHEYFAYPSEEWAFAHNFDPECVEGVGRLLAVPKTFDAPRLITAEPTAYQFLQQGLLGWIRENLPYPLRRCIDFRSQVPSRDLALMSSRDGRFATVDLSAASDRLSLWTVERVFGRTSFISDLYATRTPYIMDCTLGDELGYTTTPWSLYKFAGQGSAVTFPVQSIVYTLCCIAADLVETGYAPTVRNIEKAARSVRVFGDDLIIRPATLPYLALLLHLLQLKVNVSKTHYEGQFRESCGMDAFKGTDVTPVYLSKLSLDKEGRSLAAWVDVSNNAHRSGLWGLSSYMDAQIPQGAAKLIPASDQRLPCLTRFTFSKGWHSDLSSSYNNDLQGHGVLGLVPKTKEETVPRGDSRDLHDYFVKAARSDTTSHMSFMFSSAWRHGYSTKSLFNLKKRRVTIS